MISKEHLINLYKDIVYYPYKAMLKYPRVMSISETIELVLNSKKGVARFGDGEFHMISQTEDLGFQGKDDSLSRRLKEILLSDSDKCLILLPEGVHSVQSLTPKSKAFWKRFIVFHYHRYRSYFNFQRTYCNANITRPFMDYMDKSRVSEYFEKIKNLWKDKRLLIVEGQMSKLGVGNDLFQESSSVKRIVTASKGAFSLYDRIYDTVVANLNQCDLVLIALGPTATVLAYDLSQLDVRAIDIGHIDIEYEWFLRGATKKIAINGKHVNELAEDKIIEDKVDKLYSSQIMATIL